MRILLSIMTLCFCVCLSLEARADYSYHSTNLVNKIKPNPIVGSKPTSLIKLASVQFLSDSNRISFDKGEVDVKTECAALGFVIPVSECASPMVPSYLCSSELSREGANQYTTGCCNSNLYTAATMDSCTNNATALDDSCYWGGSKKYRCACDRSRYPYSDLDGEGCGNNGDFNVNNKCMAPDATGKQISYYTNCCPTSYEECDASKHMVGSGNSCRVETSKGNIIHKYEECVCSSNYQTPCSGNMLIDGNDYCRYNNTLYTRENNCESSCDQTRETNVDSYLYNNVWHCLYRNDGAIIKDAEEENKLCRGYNYQTSTEEDDYYDDCIAQGFIKSKEDCYVSDLILECPNDSTKVWCLDGKYCTGFDVGKNNYGNACNEGAKTKTCPSQDQGIRCKYDNDECNKCWYDGEYKAGNCQNLDTSNKGDGEKCCKRGYRMENGICVVNICDRELFPYESNPGSDQGELEICYQGDLSQSLGYRTFFGYTSCYDDLSHGGIWMQDAENPRKCRCNRQNNERGWLPFGVDKYFTSNADTSNNYTNVGFYQGLYGNAIDCTDADGSYYGYTSCFIGYTLGTSSANKNMCLRRGCTYQYYVNQSEPETRYFYEVTKEAGAEITSWPNSQGSHCINQYTHCKRATGEVKGDESACNLVVSGCLTGREAECGICYHVGNLTKNAQGLYTYHGLYLIRLNTCDGGVVWADFERCPTGYEKSRVVCRKRCSINDLSKCGLSDIVLDNDGVAIGEVFYNTKIRDLTSSNHSVGIIALEYKSLNWDDAVSYAASYVPAAYKGTSKENDALLGKGKWFLPRLDYITQALVTHASTDLHAIWSGVEMNATTAYVTAWTGGGSALSKSNTARTYPSLILKY